MEGVFGLFVDICIWCTNVCLSVPHIYGALFLYMLLFKSHSLAFLLLVRILCVLNKFLFNYSKKINYILYTKFKYYMQYCKTLFRNCFSRCDSRNCTHAFVKIYHVSVENILVRIPIKNKNILVRRIASSSFFFLSSNIHLILFWWLKM